MNENVQLAFLPSKRSSWLGFLVLLVAVYAFYYNSVYQWIFDKYGDQIYVVETVDQEAPFERITGKIEVPRYVGNTVRRSAVVAITNNDVKMLDLLLWIQISPSTDSVDTSVSQELFAFSMEDYTSQNYSPLISTRLENFAPYSSIVATFPLLATEDVNVHFFIGDYICLRRLQSISKDTNNAGASDQCYSELTPSHEVNPLIFEPRRTLNHSALEFLLMPPWSNVFLALLILFNLKILEEDTTQKPKSSDSTKAFMAEFLTVLILAILILILEIFLILMYLLFSGNSWAFVLLLGLGFFLAIFLVARGNYKVIKNLLYKRTFPFLERKYRSVLKSKSVTDTQTIVWLTTVDNDFFPQSRPVWFVQIGDDMLIYSKPNTAKVAHIQLRPRVSLHFNYDQLGSGETVIVMTGVANLNAENRPANEVPTYVMKYKEEMSDLGMTPEQFATDYSQPILIRLTGTPDL